MVAYRTLRRSLLAGVVLVLLAAPLWAQGSELKLTLRRDWGYGGFGGDIQGTFSFAATAPPDTVAVDFYIDDQLVATDTQAPWRYQFQTDDYALGTHVMRAVGHTAAGATMASNTVTNTFVSASQGQAVLVRFVLPLVGVLLLAFIIGTLISVRRSRRQGGSAAGPWGVAICPKCGRPFAMHLFGLNLGTRKYDRCPHCGKWSVVRRASQAELAALEAAAAPGPAVTPGPGPDDVEAQRRQRLEDSRFEDV